MKGYLEEGGEWDVGRYWRVMTGEEELFKDD